MSATSLVIMPQFKFQRKSRVPNLSKNKCLEFNVGLLRFALFAICICSPRAEFCLELRSDESGGLYSASRNSSYFLRYSHSDNDAHNTSLISRCFCDGRLPFGNPFSAHLSNFIWKLVIIFDIIGPYGTSSLKSSPDRIIKSFARSLEVFVCKTRRGVRISLTFVSHKYTTTFLLYYYFSI